MNLLREKNAHALTHLTSQLAHDIRSPLAALESVVADLQVTNQRLRLILRGSASRIRNIADDLLNTEASVGLPIQSKVTLELLVPLIRSILDEKRMEFRERKEIEIIFNFEPNVAVKYANISFFEFKKIISNLVNNSVEAMVSGRITIDASLAEPFIKLDISDTGKGIEAAVIEKLGTRGFTQGKGSPGSGNGLGLFHAFQCIRAWGGQVQISSEVDIGTSISILLPTAQAPSWFRGEVYASENEVTVFLGSECGPSQAWNRGEHSKANSMQFRSLSDFQNWFQNREKIEIILL